MGTADRFDFPRQRRLTESGDFRRVFADNIGVAGRYFLALARHNQQGSSRLGLVVAKKHLKRAVDRNRVKRLIRESFRLHQHTLDSVDIVVLALRGIQAGEAEQLRCDLDALWPRLKTKCEKLSPS